MKYCVNLGCWNSVFAVPSAVVDEHIKLAGAASLKVLLYLLRNSGKETEESELSEKLSLSKEDVADALGYWITCGVLARRNDVLVPEENGKAEDSAVTEIEDKTEEKPKAPAKKQKREHISYNFDECADIMSKDESVAEMLLAVEAILSRQLSHREVSMYVTLTHWYGFEPKLVPMLLHYCKICGSVSMSYVEATGLGWIDEGIDTIEKAEEKVRNKNRSRSAWRKVASLLEINRSKPTAKEENFSNLWINEWGMPSELINEAYERCINSKGKLSLAYMSGILDNWQQNDAYTLDKVRELDEKEKPKKQKKNASGRFEPTYDKNEIEQMLWDEMIDDITDGD